MLAESSIGREEQDNRKGRPPNQRFPFQKQHPQATIYLMMKHTKHRVPVLYAPQIPRRDRETPKSDIAELFLNFLRLGELYLTFVM
ncbi:unnamed protein product [Adineta ricciae]|uniref:Uncharacterized protein n=1 Tax=Adineta ricciae TaxID=249248 RepID=A0A815MGI5_ADIRI|nr:unnamed protein product [Adineta ricciae]CAF1422988.1 unnamed protein product [Adineta ricciae]